MAKVNQRLWKIPGQRAKRKAWGFTLQLDGGKRVKQYRAEWTREDAEGELARKLLQIEPEKQHSVSASRSARPVERYAAVKVAQQVAGRSLSSTRSGAVLSLTSVRRTPLVRDHRQPKSPPGRPSSRLKVGEDRHRW